MKLMICSMQYHQIVIFTHRPWVSKNYIQPRSPRQGPGYHHARRMCIESSTAIARILHIYEKHYTFRRMNNQVVAIIFSAALMLLYVTISNTFSSNKNNSENTNSNAEMVAYLNLCFRALDELGQSFENAKRTRDFLVSLQRRWQAHMRRSGPAKKRQVSKLLSQQSAGAGPGPSTESDPSRKKFRISAPRNQNHSSYPLPPPAPSSNMPSTHNISQPQSQTRQPAQQSLNQSQSQRFGACQPGDLDWIRDSDFQLLAENLGDGRLAQMGTGNQFEGENVLPSLSDIEPWWDSPNGHNFGGSSL